MRKFSIFNFQFSIFLLLVTCYLLLVTSTQAATSEEQAIYDIEQLTRPGQSIPTQPDTSGNPIQNFLTLLGNLKDSIGDLFWNEPENKGKVHAQAEALQQSDTPSQVESTNSNPIEQLKGFLGGPTGFFGSSLPEELQEKGIGDTECVYEVVFPVDQGVRPLTEKLGCNKQ